jgi:co-chaperonin GroES (HSP10)
MSTVVTDLAGTLDVSKIRPCRDYILFEVMERNRSGAGLILPGKEKTECLFGKVLAVGPGEESPRTGQVFPMDIKPGDYIVSVQYMGEIIQTIGKKYRLLREHGVWAKIKIDYRKEGDWEITDIEPYRQHILVKMDSDEKSLKGGVYLPANPQVMFRMATLVKSGPGPRDKKTGVVSSMGMNAGDRLIVMRFAGCIIRMNGVEHRLASCDDVEGVMEAGSVVDVFADPTTHPKPVDDYEVIPDSHLDELNAKILKDNGASK